jgi:hypothetical protein
VTIKCEPSGKVLGSGETIRVAGEGPRGYPYFNRETADPLGIEFEWPQCQPFVPRRGISWHGANEGLTINRVFSLGVDGQGRPMAGTSAGVFRASNTSDAKAGAIAAVVRGGA